MATVTVAFTEVQQLIGEKLVSAGVSEEQAAKIAAILIHADLRGVNSHGALRTEHYMKRLKAGGINPTPDISFNKTGPVTGVVNGDDGFGHVVADIAMDHAIEMAKENGVGMVTAMNSSHCGALSYFVQEATEQQLIGIAMTHTDKIVVPFGGRESFLGTNPIAYGVPAKTEKPFILDMATSNVALGKILQHKEEGKAIPEGWGVDKNGATVTDPAEVVSLMPFGGPKGSGLSMIVDIFSGLLAGMAFGPHINPMYEELEKKRKLGHYFCAINPSFFTDSEIFLEQMDKMIQEIREVPAAEGFSRVLVPGEIEQENEERNRKQGVQIAATTYEYLKNQ
ncbi:MULTISPECIES: ureidoglycolate dehydrogenase [Planococcus]|uniref:Ureidoglycolate dehydrogenase n=1 Tax=Planococcus wigleyi TaxID=2762216 RepID=A0ABR8WDD5_9BACL|nr:MULTISPECIES: ureidoglycolate dehydrogenase [Planococcus]MBD8014997.1 ureidoglycolate dehydrogenase [Planococcus wigleyi]MBF6633743.1 ureidoglycolate dehydrogenase [Planococcus sp. (in: firmicutes)]MDN3439063.1 ureidoglycolate dehydrogenase [Planococcus sp. APC 3900]